MFLAYLFTFLWTDRERQGILFVSPGEPAADNTPNAGRQMNLSTAQARTLAILQTGAVVYAKHQRVVKCRRLGSKETGTAYTAKRIDGYRVAGFSVVAAQKLVEMGLVDVDTEESSSDNYKWNVPGSWYSHVMTFRAA